MVVNSHPLYQLSYRGRNWSLSCRARHAAGWGGVIAKAPELCHNIVKFALQRGAPNRRAKGGGMEAGAGPLQFTHFNDLARGGTIARFVAFRNIPGPSVPQIIEEVHPTGIVSGRVFCV